MVKYSKYLIVLFLLVVPAYASQIQATDQYQDYTCAWYTMDNSNITLHPVYTHIDVGTEYNLTACNYREGYTDNISIPKRTWLHYNFMDTSITRYAQIDNFSQISGLVTKINSTSWYLKLPFITKQYQKTTENLIDLGIFKETLNFSIADNNSVNYPFHIVTDNKQIDIYFNPQNFSGVTYPLFINENTFIVASSTIQYSSDSVAFTSNTAYSILKEIRLNDSYTGSWTINFDMSSSLDDFDTPTTSHGKIYKNASNVPSPYGIEQTTSSQSFSTFSQTFTNILINNTDTIQLYGYNVNNNGGTCNVRNFRIMFNISTPPQTAFNFSGFVKNVSGSGLNGATVSFGSNSTTSNATGYYNFSNISNGVYSVTASLPGYNSNTTNITINGSDLANQNFTLSLIPAVPFNITGFVNNTLGAPVDNVRIDLNSTMHTYSRTDYLVNNTDLAPAFGTGQRVQGVTYKTNDEIQVYLFVMANTTGSGDLDIDFYLNGIKVQDDDTHVTASTPGNRSKWFTIPQNAAYEFDIFGTNVHHYEWREYQQVHGYYNFDNVSTGNYSMLFRQVGYDNKSISIALSNDTVVNATIIPTIEDDSQIFNIALLGFILALMAIGLIVRHRRLFKHNGVN